MKNLLGFTAFLFLWVHPLPLFSQACCGSGSSLVAGGHPTLDEHELLVQTGFSHTVSQNPDRTREGISATLAFGLTHQLALSLSANYAFLHSSFVQNAVRAGGVELFPAKLKYFDNHDFGDGTIGVQWTPIPMDVFAKWELKIGTSLTIPSGPDLKEFNNAELPRNMQTGNGSYAISGFVSYAKSLPALHLAGAATLAGRMLSENRHNEKPGAQGSAMTSVVIGPFAGFSIYTSLNYKRSRLTVDAKGNTDISSAGHRLDFTPGVQLVWNERFKTMIDAVLPVWRDIYETKSGSQSEIKATLLFFIPTKHNAASLNKISS